MCRNDEAEDVQLDSVGCSGRVEYAAAAHATYVELWEELRELLRIDAKSYDALADCAH